MYGHEPLGLRRLFTLLRGVMTDVMPAVALPGARTSDPVVRPIREAPPVSSHDEIRGFFGRGG